MAGKNTVTLTFAGDSKSLERELDKVNAGTKKAEEGLEQLGDQARKTEQDVDGLGDQMRHIDKVMGTGGRQFGDYGRGLGGVGDRADEVDTRMMGLSDGIQGVTDLMGGNGKLAPHEMAMAFSDLGSAAYNTVIPSLQSAGKGVQALAANFAGLKTMAIATGAAIGAAGLVLALKAYNDAADEARGKKLAEEFEKTGDASELLTEITKGNDFAMGDLANQFDNLLSTSPVLAQALLDQADAAGVLTDEMRDKAQQAIDEMADAEERLATSIRGTTDAMRARIDPFFAVIDADRAHRDALIAVDEAEQAAADAMKEHGRGSEEYATALRALQDAQIATTQTAYGQEVAIQELAQSMLDTGATTEDTIAHFQGLADKGVISQQAVDNLTSSLRNVPSRTDTTIQAHDFATTVINAVGDRARVIDGTIVDILMQASWIGGGSAYAAFTGRTRAGGGIVDYMASGGISRGPKGTDTVPTWLTPGEMVLNDRHQARLWDMLNGSGGGSGGGSTINVYVNGSVLSDRDLVRVIRDEIQRGGFGGLGA